ncbi:nitrogenase cofactor biosynthesis protein NifB [Desulforhabdus amnigena]|uniref:FeMo cofactor biosynthesis protein NifB n=1 Tax=Desulforhabdus amnigena TaxID=40218 RepID=A0A9W6FTM8_9BACT|nr:nitrogenase cofactor biosynthesis protein NifB [Desulforhabdus amnigena]NLJ29024.1 nitrogenase cofactor biosynthesis protein NifB [Deltaproteobacteria bacterium]GLI33681.1 nitrogenase cofactor biosynthesis protein NifB [Desulforhabdus amnigena]
MTTTLNLDRHPCFNVEVKGKCGRVHLPVAPQCNIKCNYCNRKYDCVNESRPGVTSAVLSPVQAVEYMEKVLEKEPRITVAGIAGPGDPFANAFETVETMRLIREKFPEMLLCLATNGLNLAPYVDELARIGVSHVTVTVNAVDPEIGQKIYSWVRDGKVIYRGLRAAELLLERQLEAIKALKAKGMVVKVNTIVMPGINDHHIEEVAKKMAEIEVDVLNCMPLYPNADTVFESVHEPSREQMVEIRKKAEEYLPQMRHCTRCRADAVGLLGEDKSDAFRGCLSACATSLPSSEARPYVAVATIEGLLVNQHLGEAARFQIWKKSEEGFEKVAERKAPPSGGGPKRWEELARVLQDCRAVLVSGIGEHPRKILTKTGVLPVEMSGFIEMGLEAVFNGRNLSEFKVRRSGGCTKGQGCQGDGSGC